MSRAPHDATELTSVNWAEVPMSRLLAECGLLAAGYGLPDQADKILAAVHALEPASAVPDIGYALGLLRTERGDEAITLLRGAQGRVSEQDRPAVQAMLGWVLSQQGHRAEGEQLLQRVARDASGGAKSLADAVLAEMRES